MCHCFPLLALGRLESEGAARAALEKVCRNLESRVSELQEDLETERDAGSKAAKKSKQLASVSSSTAMALS